MSDEVKKLRRRGVSSEDLQLALGHQASQRRVGAPVQRLAEIVGLDPVPSKKVGPVPLQARQLRGKEAGEQASLIARQLALTAKTITAAADFRQAAALIDKHHDRLQLEFDLMAGNTSVGHQYHDVINQRLLDSGVTFAQHSAAINILWTLTRHIKFQSYEVDINPTELAKIKNVERGNLSRILKLLESVGAIKQVRKGRYNTICITPEAIYRGPVQAHSSTVRKYKLEVLSGGKDQSTDNNNPRD